MTRDNELIRRGDVREAVFRVGIECGTVGIPTSIVAAVAAVEVLPAIAPTLTEALALPEVQALVEFVQEVRRNGDERLASMAVANLAQVGKY